MTINYQIKMLSNWHVGSGLDAGMDADSLVLKDENNLPLIPGKTLKGLLKDALLDINEVQPNRIMLSTIQQTFGDRKADENGKVIRTETGYAFFSNAYLSKKEAKEIVNNQLSSYLYKNISSTAIGRKNEVNEIEGIAKEGALRTIQVTIPVTLHASITNLNDEDKKVFDLAFKWLRHLGVNRNRGLGRCELSTL